MKPSTVRALLVADLAAQSGAAQTADVVEALRTFWTDRSRDADHLIEALRRHAHLSPEALAAVEAEADRLIEAADGDAEEALTRYGRVGRSLHAALTTGAPCRVQPQRGDAATGRPDLRPMPEGRYVDFIPVGEGGMGVVYLAFDTELHRLVALKIVRPDAGDGGAAAHPPDTPTGAMRPSSGTPAAGAFDLLAARFLQEAWVTGGLEHPGVVPVYALGSTASGVPYYTMRFIPGQRTLRDALDALDDAGIEERLRLLEPFLKLCDTVAYAHSRGVIHRDLKPENVALGEFGEVVLLDWGLARTTSDADPETDLWHDPIQKLRETGDLKTMAGAIGTPGYMAPELAEGRLDDVGPASDVYGLGVLLFEILTGRLPYGVCSYVAYVQKVMTVDAPEAAEVAPDVPGGLSVLCAAALVRDPARRTSTAEALAEALRTWQSASAHEREVRSHLREARAALAAAEADSGEQRLRNVERAAASLHQVPDDPAWERDLQSLRAQADMLREQSLQERARDAGRRLLIRVGVAALVLAVVAATLVARGLARERRATETAYREVLRLADTKRVADLGKDVQSWQTTMPDLAARISAWIDRAAELAARRPQHARTLAALRHAGITTPERAWQQDVLSELVDDLEDLEGRKGPLWIQVRNWEQNVREVDAAEATTTAAWEAASERLREDARFEGLVLRPLRGLVPLGPDPDSRLEEFACVGTGSVPKRDGEGRLHYARDAAIVLVLIPGGRDLVGGQDQDPDAPNFVDSQSGSFHVVEEVEVAPFLLGKHECTQTQWRRMTGGEVPSFFGTWARTGRAPVEQVSHADCMRWLPRYGLTLPDETAWEYACRAGTDTAWWCGDDPAAIDAIGWYAGNAGEHTNPVGGKPANPFGLHDMAGNVTEWCSNLYEDYADVARLNIRSGCFPGHRAVRGGSWYDSPFSSYSAVRRPDPAEYTCNLLGFRPARMLDASDS